MTLAQFTVAAAVRRSLSRPKGSRNRLAILTYTPPPAPNEDTFFEAISGWPQLTAWRTGLKYAASLDQPTPARLFLNPMSLCNDS